MSLRECVIVISHGMAEHLGRYEWFINQLNHDGFHVYGRNHREDMIHLLMINQN